jgi:hypothetical protein
VGFRLAYELKTNFINYGWRKDLETLKTMKPKHIQGIMFCVINSIEDRFECHCYAFQGRRSNYYYS